MRACVVFLSGRARLQETQRRLAELRMLMDGVRDVPIGSLPWQRVRVDRSSRRWMTLLQLARLFLARDWEATHHDAQHHRDGVSLLFPMHDLFEAIVAKAFRQALAPLGLEVVSQCGFLNCLGPWVEHGLCTGTLFRTKPDIIIRAGGRTVAVLDTKWKCLKTVAEDRKRGIVQGDIYQLMAYSQLYECNRLMLLYPRHAGLPDKGLLKDYGVAVPGSRPPARLQVATIDVANDLAAMVATIRPLILGLGISC